MRLLILETVPKSVPTASRHGASLPYRSHAGVLSTVMIGDGTPMRQLIVETVANETAGKNAVSPVSRTRMLTLPKPSDRIAANARPCPIVSRICCLTDNPGGNKDRIQRQPSGDIGCQCGVSHGTPRENTPMRQLTVEIVNGETTGKRAAWSLSAAMWARWRLSATRKNTVDHYAEVLSTVMIEGGKPVRLLILETIDGEATRERMAWSLPTAMWLQRWLSATRKNTVDQCTEVLSTTMIAGGTPRRQLILETINGETAGERIAWPLPTAMWTRRWPGKATHSNGIHRVKALSTAMNAGGTPMRLLILETIDGELAGNNTMSPVSHTQIPTLPWPGISIAANAHSGPRVSRINCLTDSPGGDPGWTVIRRGGNACHHCDISWVTSRRATLTKPLTVRSNGIAPISCQATISRTLMPTQPRPGVSIAANAHPGPVVSRICCLTDSPGGDPGWTVARRLSNACRHSGTSDVTPRSATPLLTIAAPG